MSSLPLPEALNPRETLRAALPFLGPPPDLQDLRYLLMDRGVEVADAFYHTIQDSTEAMPFIESAEKLAKLHASLVEWLKAFLSAPPDAHERGLLAIRMTRAHLVIGMPLELTMLGHHNLRRIVLRELLERWPADDRLGLIDATDRLNRAFDYDLLLMVSTYHSGALGRANAVGSRLQDANERLQASVAAQENLLRSTGHELRTPLTAMLGMLDLLQQGAYRTAEAAERAQQDLHGAARHLHTLVDDLMHLSRLDVGKSSFQPQDCDVHEVAEAVARRLQPRFDEEGLQLRVVGEGPIHAHADPERCAQVLSNLLQNALRHTTEGGVEIHFDELPGGSHLLVQVKDSGEGLEPALQARLFEPFSQGTRRQGGLGLGLAISRRLVLGMGGRIRALSDGPGQGSCFEFTLPLPGRHQPPRCEAGDARSSTRILVVDDDAVWRHDMVEWLAAAVPARVLGVGSAATALEIVGQQHFDLILVDVALPSVDGHAHQDGISLLEALACRPASMLAPKWLVSGHPPAFLAAELEQAW
ncbi:MAG: response regulator, partial [Rhodocyclaceae bacterium]|nr:response regulator [Rhodocyclaceae bacterium]